MHPRDAELPYYTNDSLFLHQAIEYDDGSVNGTMGMWVETRPAPGLSPPECIETQWSRDNHLGNTIGGFPAYYNWTVPNDPNEHCVLRIRSV